LEKETTKKADHYSSIHWFNMDYWLLNGFLLPEVAHTALCELVDLGRFPDLDSAIREGIKIILEENGALLVRHDRKWLPQLADLREVFKDASNVKPDEAGMGNVRLLDQMREASEKAAR
jgi:Arc/MetJ-type ribon-helix-helix transcriptional regulator